MSLDPTKKRLLNLLGESQPALNDKDKPHSESNINLGDIVDGLSVLVDVLNADKAAAEELVADYGENKRYEAEATYDFAEHGGAQGEIDLGLTLPAEAIVTQVVTRTITSLAGAGASVALEVGATVLKAATAFDDASYTGLKFQIDPSSADPILVAAESNLEWVISGADLTDGKMRVIVSYILP